MKGTRYATDCSESAAGRQVALLVDQLATENERLTQQARALREFVEDIAEGRVGNHQMRAMDLLEEL